MIDAGRIDISKQLEALLAVLGFPDKTVVTEVRIGLQEATVLYYPLNEYGYKHIAEGRLPRDALAEGPDHAVITCTLSPITCRCGGTHRPLTTPAGIQLEPGQTEAQRRTRLLVGARSVGDANRAMTGKPPKCECGKGAKCLSCIERDGLTKAQDGSPRAVNREVVQTTGETGSS